MTKHSDHTRTPWHYDDTAIFAQDGVLARIPNHPENGKNWLADADLIVKAVHAYTATPPQKATDLQPIVDARRDGTPILIKLKDHIPVESMQRWQGLTFVGCLREPYDFTWRFAAPIGQGGFRDEWIEGWWSLAQFRQCDR